MSNNSIKSNSQRFLSIDLLRGFAVLLMIVFHFFYDYAYFGYWDVNLNKELEWVVFRYIIVSLFLFTVGISLNLSHRKKIALRSVIRRTIILGGASIIISVVSYLIFPQKWIYFGIIHFILVSSLLGLALRQYPMLCLLLAVVIVVGYAEGYVGTNALYQALEPTLHLPKDTEDLVRFFPWFSVVLLGMYFSYYRFYDLSQTGYEDRLSNSSSRIIKGLVFMGKNALLIYLIHQPILFGGFLLVQQVF